ncbi:hypothetical protein, partial [Massilia aerilata]
TYNMETGANLKTYATFNYNTYTGNNVNVFQRYWDGKSAGVTNGYTGWKAWSGQDKDSKFILRKHRGESDQGG